MRPIVYIDPQSFRNLSIYDHCLLSHIEGDIHYLCSRLYDYKPLPSNVHQHKIFGYNDLKSNWTKAVSYLWSYFIIFFLLLKWHPQAIHLQWMRIPAFDVHFMNLVKKLTGSKLVFTAHNILPHDTGERYLNIYRKLYKKADTVIVHTHATKRELIQKMGIAEDKISVIDHGVLQPLYDPTLLKEQQAGFASHYQLDGKMVFSSLGYQYYYKGVDLLAEVWSTTPELYNNDQCKLLLVGKNMGVDLSAVKGIINVIIDDKLLSEEEFYYLMTHTDVSLLPYRTISQSGLLLTAIYLGVPFLVTNVGGLAEPLDIANVGWLLPQLSSEDLRQQLLWFINHPDEVRTMKTNQANWEKVRQHYSWERIGALTQKVYYT